MNSGQELFGHEALDEYQPDCCPLAARTYHLAVDQEGPHQGRGAMGGAVFAERGDVQVVTLSDCPEVVFIPGIEDSVLLSSVV